MRTGPRRRGPGKPFSWAEAAEQPPEQAAARRLRAQGGAGRSRPARPPPSCGTPPGPAPHGHQGQAGERQGPGRSRARRRGGRRAPPAGRLHEGVRAGGRRPLPEAVEVPPPVTVPGEKRGRARRRSPAVHRQTAGGPVGVGGRRRAAHGTTRARSARGRGGERRRGHAQRGTPPKRSLRKPGAVTSAVHYFAARRRSPRARRRPSPRRRAGWRRRRACSGRLITTASLMASAPPRGGRAAGRRTVSPSPRHHGRDRSCGWPHRGARHRRSARRPPPR